MVILVDGDGCPELQTIKELAYRYGVKMTVFIDYAHFIQDDYFKIVMCEIGNDSVDMNLLKQTQTGDLVITQDYGLASLVLSKGAKVLHTSGKVIDNSNIDQLLMSRFVSAKQRRKGVRVKGPAKRTEGVRNAFYQQLEKMLEQG